MRTHIYLRDFPPAGTPLKFGPIKAVHGLASGLAANGCRVTVLCEGEADSQQQGTGGYDIRCFHNPSQRPTDPLAEGLVRYLAGLTPDGLILLNGIFHPSVYSVARELWKHKLPYAVVPHDPYHPAIFARRAWLKWPYWYLRERRVIRRAQAVQVLDARHGQWLERLGVTTPVVESPNGFSPTEVPPQPALRWGQNEPPSMVFVGRLDAHNKGLDLLLDAFAGLPAGAARLTLQGPDWGDKAALASRAAQLRMSDIVKFADPDFNTSSPMLIARHDVYCLPSRFEGFGLAALEAMLAARVVLVSDIAGIAPHVRASGCGVVVSPDPESVRKGLLELLAKRADWKDMGLAGRQYVLQNLRWEKIGADTLAQYVRLRNAPLSAGPAKNQSPTDAPNGLIARG